MHENLASYASSPEKSKGRLHEEPISFRNEFQRDTNRITNSTSFRRLVYKTQVFVNDTGDHYRTRLTHSLEVAQIGKVIAAALDLSTELTECLALAHDIGHPPFGHAGENALNLCMQNHGGFDHNEYTLKLLTKLEERYLDFDGLNLCWETLDGIIKHNGPVLQPRPLVKQYALLRDIDLTQFPSLEAQVASLSDDIAYNSHDLEDGLRAEFFSIDDVYDAGVIRDIIDEVRAFGRKIDNQRMIHAIIRRLVNNLVSDLIEQSRANISMMKICSLQDVHEAGVDVINFSDSMRLELNKLRKFLYTNMYRHYLVNRMTYRAGEMVKSLFKVFVDNPGCLPQKWQEKISDSSGIEEVVCDYIAGMTDRYAMAEYERLGGF